MGIICCQLDLGLPQSDFIHVLYFNSRGETGLRTSLLERVQSSVMQVEVGMFYRLLAGSAHSAARYPILQGERGAAGAGAGLTMRRGTSWKAENASAGAPDKSRNVTRRPRSQLRLMTSDQGDLRASAFPLVLAAASIGEGARRRSSIPPRSHKCNIPAQLSPRDVLQAGGPGSRSKAKSASSPVLILVPTF